MNVAGRKIVGSMFDVLAMPGRRVVERRFHGARHVQRVAPGLFLDDQQQARSVVDHGVADRRRETFDHVGHFAQTADGAPPGNRRPRLPDLRAW